MSAINFEQASKTNRSLRPRALIFSIVTLPTILDYILYETIAARLLRIFLFLLSGVNLFLALRKKHPIRTISQSNDTKSINLILASVFLLITAIGILGDLLHRNKVTPEFLIIICFIVTLTTLDLDCNETIDLLYKCGLFLVFCSFLGILFGFNPRGEYLSEAGYFVPFNGLIGIPGRQFGVFSAPNELAQISSIVFVWSILQSKSRAVALVSIFCVLESGSRASLAVTVILTVLLTLYKRRNESRREKRYANTLEKLVISNSSILLLLTFTLYIYQVVLTAQEYFLNNRSMIWNVGFQSLTNDNFFFGLGWQWYSTFSLDMRLPEWATNAHNLFLEILFATGFIGFLMFLTLLVLVFSKQQPLNIKLMISFLLLGGFTESTIQFIYPVFTTYLFLALILARSEEVK